MLKQSEQMATRKAELNARLGSPACVVIMAMLPGVHCLSAYAVVAATVINGVIFGIWFQNIKHTKSHS